MYTSAILAVATLTTIGSAQVRKGFNYGATDDSGACRGLSDFTGQFNTAKNLVGTSGFTSARLYTMIQCGTTNTPISAIQAAIDTDTSILLGLWASAGDAQFGNELAALTNAINQYGTAFTDRVIGISVGSEDLYRSSPQGVANNAGVGVGASTIIDYIGRVRSTVSGTALSGKPVGHVDTWTAWVLPENSGVVGAVDWLGHNSFPYFESTLANSIDVAYNVFYNALGATEGVSTGKPVWVTETGWPHSGPTSNQAVASIANAQRYYSEVGCSLFNVRNTWWYTLSDANTAQTDISFGIAGAGNPPSTTPIFTLTC